MAWTPLQYLSHIERNLKMNGNHTEPAFKGDVLPWLTSDVPEFDGDPSLCYLSHVEAHCWDHVLTI